MCVYDVTFFLLTENLSAKKTYLRKGSNTCRVYDVVVVFCKVIVLLVYLSPQGLILWLVMKKFCI